MTLQAPTIHPTTLAVIHGWLGQIADEMDLVLARSAFSTVISEQLDRACGIYDCETGGTIVQGRSGLPVFVGSMQFAVQAVQRRVRAESAQPGDIFMLNDPYLAGTHLHDFKLVQPFFYEGKLTAYMAATGHWMDVGSSQPGGWNPRATDVIQEGIRVPPVRVVEAGQLNKDILAIILANLRLPRDSRGDFQAKLNALHVGERRLREAFERYGSETVQAVIRELANRAEEHMRSYIREIPDGDYSFQEQLDDDGINEEPLTIALRLSVRGSEITFDFTGSSPPCRGPYNTPKANVVAACYIAMKHLFSDVPLNSGCFRPMHFVIPDDTFLAARFPQSHGGYLDVSCRVMDTVLGALAPAVPDRAVAAPFSTLPIFALAGDHPDTGKYYVTILFLGGGYGGSKESDGLVNGALPIGIARVASVEVMEQRFPIRYESFSIREDSGGAGWHAGGCAAECDIRFLGAEGSASNLADRVKFAPFGVLGGKPGTMTEISIVRDGEERRLAKETGIVLRRGDQIRMRYPGGGGYGNPLERPVDLVVRDVRRGYVSRARARDDYGVAFLGESLEVDQAVSEVYRRQVGDTA